MWAKLLVLIVLASAGHSVIEAAPAASRHNLSKLLQELHKSAPPVVQKLSRRAVKIRSKNLVNEIRSLLRAHGTRTKTPLDTYRHYRRPLEEYEDDLRALINEAISLDAVNAVKDGFGVEDDWRSELHRLWYGVDNVPPSVLRPTGRDLKLAAEHGSVRAAKVMIKCEGSCITAVDVDDAFVIAAQHDNVEVMKLLIKYGGDAFTAATEQAAAHKSVVALRFLTKYSSEEEVVAAILRHDDTDALRHVATEIKQELLLAETDLGQAIVTGVKIEEIKHLIDAGADVNDKGMSQDFPLAQAALLGKWRLVAILLDAGAEINATGKHGRTALHQALQLGHHEAAALLLNRGADPTIADDLGYTPEMLAHELNDSTLIKLIERAKQLPAE